MKQGQFSQVQIVAILQQAERGEQTIQAICREHTITETTFYRWRKIYVWYECLCVSALKMITDSRRK